MISLQENESVSFCLNRVYGCKKNRVEYDSIHTDPTDTISRHQAQFTPPKQSLSRRIGWCDLGFTERMEQFLCLASELFESTE